MSFVIQGKLVTGNRVSSLANGNAATPSLCFAEAAGTGVYHAGDGVLGLTANGTSVMMLSNTGGVSVTAPTANVSITVPWVAANTVPVIPVAPTLSLDVTTLNLTNSDAVTTWGTATGYAVGTGGYPTYKKLSAEPADQYVAFPGNTITTDTTNGSYLNFGTTTWNVATNGGFTYVGLVNFNAASSSERLFDFGSGAPNNNILLQRFGATANLYLTIHQSTTGYSLATTTSPMSTGGSSWQVVGARVQNTGTNAWGLSIWVNGINIASSALTSTVLSDRTVTNSYVGRSNWAADSYASYNLREALFYNRALSDAEMATVSAYLTSKYSTLYYTYPIERSLSVLGNNASTSMKITTNGDMSSVRSVNGLVIKNPRGWNAPNFMRLDILKYLQASRDSCCIMPGLDGVRVGGGTFVAAWSGVLLADGRVYCIPGNSGTTARIYDPSTDTTVAAGGTFPATTFYGGVLMNDGRVFCVPRGTTTARIYDPVTDTLSTPAGTYAGSEAFLGAVLLNDGRVFLIPASSTTARIYDPAADSVMTPAGTYPGTYFSVSGTLLPDGRVFMVPHNSTSARIYDPASDTLSTPSGTYPGAYSLVGGVLLPDGRVYCVPAGSSTARIYNPITDSTTIPSGVFPTTGAAFNGGCLLPDGRVFISPCSSTTARIYDPVTDTLTTPRGTYPGGSSFGSPVLLPDGRVFLVPYNSATCRLAHCGGWGSVRLPLSVVTSPYLNRR